MHLLLQLLLLEFSQSVAERLGRTKPVTTKAAKPFSVKTVLAPVPVIVV